jgi:hypothetical protein
MKAKLMKVKREFAQESEALQE